METQGNYEWSGGEAYRGAALEEQFLDFDPVGFDERRDPETPAILRQWDCSAPEAREE